jgi:hypothetical protein
MWAVDEHENASADDDESEDANAHENDAEREKARTAKGRAQVSTTSLPASPANRCNRHITQDLERCEYGVDTATSTVSKHECESERPPKPPPNTKTTKTTAKTSP